MDGNGRRYRYSASLASPDTVESEPEEGDKQEEDIRVSSPQQGNCCTSVVGDTGSGKPRDDSVIRRYYSAFIVIMFLVSIIVVVACVCAAKRDLDHLLTPSRCATGMFECEKIHACINDTLMCNQVYDCEDRTDEGSKCDMLHDKYYETILQKRPDAETDRVDPFCSLHGVPDGCHCNNKTNVYCENDFHQVPPHLPNAVTYLDLSGNDMPVIGAHDMGFLPHLNKLVIVDAGVRLIEDGAFSGLSSLREVQLTNNQLVRVPGKAFAENRQLRILQVRANSISRLTLEHLQSFPDLEYLNLNQNNISFIAEDAFSRMPKLKRLDLSQNKLQIIRSTFFRNLPSLQGLYLNQNGIAYIETGSFSSLRQLGALDLLDNKLRHIHDGVFTGLGNVTVLQLANNGIRTIDPEAFSPLVNVRSMLLTGNHLQNLTNRTFSHMRHLDYIYFDKFYMCVYVQHAGECEPGGDGISSRYNLLENLVLRVCVWLVAVLACVGNVLVFLGRFLLREDNQIHSFFIKNLSLADMLMGVYLLVIGSQDIKFRGEYLLHDEAWRHSRECDMCGVLSTLSTEMSVLTLCIITLDRYISIMYPLSFRKRGLKAAYGAMGCTWLICLMLALLPVMGFRYFGTSFYRDNAVCVPLHIHDPRAQGWEYSSFLFLGINLASFAFIAYAYTAMFWSIHRSAIPLRSSRESKERCLVKRFFFIVITDFLCWIPIIIIKVIALAGVSISANLYAWVIVFILPVNSALNPLLYTLTTKLFKQTLLSKFTSVVWRPTIVKDGSVTSRASVRGNSSINRNPLQDVELEMLRRHGCYKNGSTESRHKREPPTTTSTPVTSTSTPTHFWNSGGSPPRLDVEQNGAILCSEYSQI